MIFSVRTEAADLNTPAAPAGLKDEPGVPAISWTGFYAGVNGGYGWGANNSSIYVIGTEPDSRGATTTEVSPVTKYDRSGGFGGGQIGYSLQRDRIVFGVETDFQGADIQGSGSASVVLPKIGGRGAAAISVLGEREGTLDWFGTVRGRLGYAYDQALIYFTGGLAYGGSHGNASIELTNGAFSDRFTEHLSANRLGYVLGGGVEYALNRSWSLKAEYQFIDLGQSSGYVFYNTAAGGGGTGPTGRANFTTNQSYNTVRLGVNYHLQEEFIPLK